MMDGIRDTSVTGVQTCALPISTAAHCRCRPCSPLKMPPEGAPREQGSIQFTDSLILVKDYIQHRQILTCRWKYTHCVTLLNGDRHGRSEERRVGKECR